MRVEGCHAPFGRGVGELVHGHVDAASLDDNRELGLIIADPAVLSATARTFAADFRISRGTAPGIPGSPGFLADLLQ
jgi:hypothetical protein